MRLGRSVLGLGLCLALSGCGKDEAPEAKPRAQPTVDDCKAQLEVYRECHAETHAKSQEGVAPEVVAQQIAAVKDYEQCAELLGELQKSGIASCWPS